MRQALIGYSGFVGSNLLETETFTEVYNSKNISGIRGKKFDRIICAGASAVKWWANKNPDEDLAKINDLIAHLEAVECDRFTLISTIDVYRDPRNVTELDIPRTEGLHAYGLHRLLLESRVKARFPLSHIVRLPALFGKHLRKNAIFDLIHNNQVDLINPAGVFAWYPVERLGSDLALIESHNLDVINLATEPLSMSAIIDKFFPGAKPGPENQSAPCYDFHTIHAGIFGRKGNYVMSQAEVLASLTQFLAANFGIEAT